MMAWMDKTVAWSGVLVNVTFCKQISVSVTITK
jgi:hypothetical protein